MKTSFTRVLFVVILKVYQTVRECQINIFRVHKSPIYRCYLEVVVAIYKENHIALKLCGLVKMANRR